LRAGRKKPDDSFAATVMCDRVEETETGELFEMLLRSVDTLKPSTGVRDWVVDGVGEERRPSDRSPAREGFLVEVDKSAPVTKSAGFRSREDGWFLALVPGVLGVGRGSKSPRIERLPDVDFMALKRVEMYRPLQMRRVVYGILLWRFLRKIELFPLTL